MARGARTATTVTCGTPPSLPDGVLYDYGHWSPVPAYGSADGSVTTRGDGRRTTTAGGGSQAGAGSGLLDEHGAGHGCRGRPRRVTSAGVPWATAGALGSRSACRSAVHGMDGSSCPIRTSAMAIGTPFTIMPFRQRRSRTARRSRYTRAPRSRRPSPLGGPSPCRERPPGVAQVRASAGSAPGRQPVTVPRAERTDEPRRCVRQPPTSGRVTGS